jgi:SNF family Na+-dependent transporter
MDRWMDGWVGLSNEISLTTLGWAFFQLSLKFCKCIIYSARMLYAKDFLRLVSLKYVTT